MKKNVIIALIIIFLVTIFFLYFKPEKYEEKLIQNGASVCFSAKCVKAEIADTEEEREKGLMFRESLNEDEGMLFIFDQEGIYPFWMKNTLIPLDIIWISSSNRIAHFEFAYPCETENCISYTPRANANNVLEVNHGFIEKNNIQIGDLVEISYFR